MKQSKKPFRHFFLRSAAGFLAGTLALGAASTAAFFLYETKCAESDAALNHQNFLRKIDTMDIASCTDNELRLQLALYATLSGASSHEIGMYLDKAYLLYDPANNRVLDSKPIAWTLIKGTAETEADIPNVPELADAETGDYFDGSTFFKKSFYNEDPDVIEALHPYTKHGAYYERECCEIYAKGSSFVPGKADIKIYSPFFEKEKSHNTVDCTPPDTTGYTHFYDNNWQGEETKVPEDAVGIETLFLLTVGSEKDSTALKAVHDMYDHSAKPDDLYLEDSGYQIMKAKGGTRIAVTAFTQGSEENPKYIGYYICYYHFWEHWGLFLLVYYAVLLILALVLAALTGKVRYQSYSKQYELNDYRRRLTGALAHDLKSPLAAISGYAENLRENVNTEKREHYADSIMQTAAHMDHIIADVLTLAKLEDSDIPQRETLDLVALAKEAFALLQEDTEKRGITIRFSGNCKASANTAMMTRAIENLAANAVRYTPENGCIDVTGQNDVFRISNDADTAQITDADQLCEPFVKGNSARTSGAGSGMGLAIVKQTAKLHGFRFRTESENGKFIAKLETKK